MAGLQRQRVARIPRRQVLERTRTVVPESAGHQARGAGMQPLALGAGQPAGACRARARFRQCGGLRAEQVQPRAQRVRDRHVGRGGQCAVDRGQRVADEAAQLVRGPLVVFDRRRRGAGHLVPGGVVKFAHVRFLSWRRPGGVGIRHL